MIFFFFVSSPSVSSYFMLLQHKFYTKLTKGESMENISLYLRVLFLKTTLKMPSYFFKSKDTLKEIIWSYRLHPQVLGRAF